MKKIILILAILAILMVMCVPKEETQTTVVLTEKDVSVTNIPNAYRKTIKRRSSDGNPSIEIDKAYPQ